MHSACSAPRARAEQAAPSELCRKVSDVAESPTWGIVVPGHSRRGLLSESCRRMVALAADLCAERAPRAVVFTGWSPRGGPSEAEQMLEAWPGRRDVELITERSARTTAENAARSLPLLLQRGVDEVTVVCAPLHALRVRYFFGGLYGRFGLRVELSVADCPRTPRALARELAVLGLIPWQRRAALANLERLEHGG
ncbi:MAG: hypothetical protein C5B48_15395 [Candidatus Rokuibacteriota bacterium]|nr:MAG: hypothetical protein C5B48_15395 [Candidatus Rokubacteria bacterium]